MLRWEELSLVLGTQPCEPATVPLHCSNQAYMAIPLGSVEGMRMGGVEGSGPARHNFSTKGRAS